MTPLAALLQAMEEEYPSIWYPLQRVIKRAIEIYDSGSSEDCRHTQTDTPAGVGRASPAGEGRGFNSRPESPVAQLGSTVIRHAPTCPVNRPGFRPVEGITQCNCDFGKRLKAYLNDEAQPGSSPQTGHNPELWSAMSRYGQQLSEEAVWPLDPGAPADAEGLLRYLNSEPAAGRAKYVCDAEYAPESNAAASCLACGWLISQHKMHVPKPGPFAPAAGSSDGYRTYERIGSIKARPYVHGESLAGVSVASEDRGLSSGWVATDGRSKWFINSEYFYKHYRLPDSEPAAGLTDEQLGKIKARHTLVEADISMDRFWLNRGAKYAHTDRGLLLAEVDRLRKR